MPIVLSKNMFDFFFMIFKWWCKKALKMGAIIKKKQVFFTIMELVLHLMYFVI